MARRIHITGFAVFLAASCVAFAPPGNPDPEDQLKAATVLAILHHSQWPGAQAGGRRLTVGVWGRPAMAEALRRTVDGKVINGRVARVIEVTAPPDPRCCQAIYIAAERKTDLHRILAAVARASVLTIGESERFLDSGGAIRLFVADGHMAFEASLPVLKRGDITISSRLLRFGQLRGAKAEEAK